MAHTLFDIEVVMALDELLYSGDFFIRFQNEECVWYAEDLAIIRLTGGFVEY